MSLLKKIMLLFYAQVWIRISMDSEIYFRLGSC